jgi:RND family efflux transporter MFP subunit
MIPVRRLASFVVTASLAGLLAACSGAGDAPVGVDDADGRGTPPAPVRAEPVQSAAVAHETRTVGVLAPRDELRLSFKVGGVVDRVLVESGDAVRKGQLLAEIKQAEVDATVAQASEAAEKARRDLERGERLRADEVATQEQVENLTTAYRVALANLESARFNARFARIEAPADGVVFERMVEAGELVQAGQPVMVLGDTSSGWVVRVGLADRDVVRVEPGSTVQVSFDAYPGRVFEGRVSRIGVAADRMNGTFEVEVALPASPGVRLVRGLVAKVTLLLAQLPEVAREATVVPLSALVEADGMRATVYVLDATRNVALRKDVTLGPVIGERIVVTGGLVEGEPVITDGAAWLSDGRAVRVVAGANRS